MPSRPVPANPNQPSLISRTRIIFLILTISSSLVIFFAILYFIYHLWHFLANRSRTIPFDVGAPLRLQRFTHKELKNATNDFDEANIVGKGGSGTVFRGIGKDGKLFAIKRLGNLSLQTETEFQNELQILGGLRSPFLVTLLGYCVEKNHRFLIYEYMPNKCLQEVLFGESGHLSLNWERRFSIILDVAKALEFLHFGCDPPVIHGDIKPSNVLLDSDYRAKISDFGLSRVKVLGEFGMDLFSQDLGKSQELWKSQELSGNLGTLGGESTPQAIGTPTHEVDFALALQASSSSKNSKSCYNVMALNLNSMGYNANIALESENTDNKLNTCCENGYYVADQVKDLNLSPNSVLDGKELNLSPNSLCDGKGTKTWGKDWWWKQEESGEFFSKDYVRDWIGNQIYTNNPAWDDEQKSIPEKIELECSTSRSNKFEERNESLRFDTLEEEFEKEETNRGKKNKKKKHRNMQEWWKEENLDEMSKKGNKKLKILQRKLKKGLKIPHFDLGRRFYFHRRKKSAGNNQDDRYTEGEFSFRKGWRRKNNNNKFAESEMWSGDLFSRELSSTTSMRGTLCYVAPEYGGCGYLMEKGDIYSLGVLILVIVSGRRPLHVLASPMKLEKANLVSWCRHLAQSGNILELVDERLKDVYNKEQASLCINLALICLQKMPELRPDIGEIVRILKGEMEIPQMPFEFSPSPSSKLCSRSRRRLKGNAD